MATSGTTTPPPRRRHVPDHRRIYVSSSGNFEVRYAAGPDRLAHVCDGACPPGLDAAVLADDEIQRLLGDGLLTTSRMLLVDAVTAWETTAGQRVTTGDLEAKTFERYDRARYDLEWLLDSYPPAIRVQRRKLIRDIFPHTVAGLDGRLEAGGKTDSARRLMLYVLSAILDESVARGELRYNAVKEYRRSQDQRRSRHQRHHPS
jgi:hypothetical protein